jgi:hypothetical protein
MFLIPAVHAVTNPDSDSALGMVVENINQAMDDVLEPKHAATSSYYELIERGDREAKMGNYEQALGWYNAAVDRAQQTSDSTLASVKNAHLARLYNSKASVYYQRDGPGDKERQQRALATAQTYESKAGSRSGCLIVTATYGSPMAAEVQLVREYRDGTFRQSYTGSRFVEGFNIWYYSFSPSVAGYIESHPLVRSVMQVCLIPLLDIVLVSQKIFAMMSFSPEAASVTVIIFGAAMYSLVYIFPVASLLLIAAGRKGLKIPSVSVMRYVLIAWAGILVVLLLTVLTSLDTFAVISSGLLVLCSVILASGTASLSLAGYVLKRTAVA